MSDGSAPRHDGELLLHAYDGIQEYDNPLPGWWKAFFIATVVFSAGYLGWFHLGGPGRSDHAVYAAEVKAYERARIERDAADVNSVTEQTLAAAAADRELVGRGREVFAATCVSCHQADGSGLIGPNLTDDHQLHGSSRKDVFTTIRNGVPNTAMVPWSAQLAPAEVVAVAAYVITLRNHPLPGKPAEGAAVGPFAAP